MALYQDDSLNRNSNLNNLDRQPESEIEKLLDLLAELNEENWQDLSDVSSAPTERDSEKSEILGGNWPELLPEEAESSEIDLSSTQLRQPLIKPKNNRENSALEKLSSTANGRSKFLQKYARSFERSQQFLETFNPTQSTTTSPNFPEFSQLKEAIAKLNTKVDRIEHQLYEPTELIDPLIPLMTELLSSKTLESRETFMEALVPAIDEAIKQRTQQDRQLMGDALADILPDAISQEIRKRPTQIAKAIAPEIAIAIQEQIRLDRDSIATTLGPEMGEAIKTQILVEKDAMVDALYPVIGNTISKYMVELVQTINEKVESALSIEGIKRKLRAKLEGITEAELILRETLKYKVQAVLLIHKASGLIIRDVLLDPGLQIEAEMLAGMLTAIRSFVYDCIIQPGEVSELHEIQYDSSKIVLEVAGYCYLAVVVKGEPSRKLLDCIRETLGEIILKYGRAISSYEGDPATIPNSLGILLERLAATTEEKIEKKSKPPYALVILLGLLLLTGGYFFYRDRVARHLEHQIAVALDAAPQLSVYRIVPQVARGKIILSGRVPNQSLRDDAGKIAAQIAPDWELDNQMIAVEIPPDPVSIAGEVERVTWIFNQEQGIAIDTKHDYGTQSIAVTGIAPNLSDIDRITRSLQKIPGIERVISTIQIRPILETRIYFESNSTQVNSPDLRSRITTIREFLEQNPGVHLKIIGHTDDRGQKSQNRELGVRRARVIQDALIAERINPSRLHIEGTGDLPPDVKPGQPLWMSRCVRFEVFIPTQTGQ